MNETATKSAYTELLRSIKDRIIQAQHEALKAVNKALIALYWDIISQAIAESQKSEGWGKSIIERFGKDLREAFPSMPGFSTRNLWYMRNLYREYWP